MPKKCSFCNKMIPSNTRKRKYCSIECYKKGKNPSPIRYCIICGTQIPQRSKKYKYCSKKCRHYKNNGEYSRLKYRMLALLIYSNDDPRCACCRKDIMELLEIDHINGGGKKHHTGSNLYSWLHTHNYPKGFQVLCGNCNWAKGIHKKQFCSVHHPELYK